MSERRTPKSWTHYLANEDEPITLSEYRAGVEARMLSCLIEIRDALDHLEGMAGAKDAFDARVAAAMGIPFASSSTVRAALDRERDQRRRQLTDRAGTGGEHEP